MLVLGILSLFFFGIVLGPVAAFMGTSALREIDANPAMYTNRGTVVAGRILGIVGTVLSVIGIIYVVTSG